MNVAHLRNVQPAQNGFARIQAVAFSPNNKRLAVVDSARYLHLFDESGERRDRILLRALDVNEQGKFMVKALAFSPDSTRLAVAQSEGTIFVYKVGLEWGDRRSINVKFKQQSTCMCWPPMTATGLDAIVFGNEEGEVKAAMLNRGNKIEIKLKQQSPVVALATSPDGAQFVSAHADGTVMRFTFEMEDGSAHPSGAAPGFANILTLNSTPTAIALADYLAVAGSDCIIRLYDRLGNEVHKFECNPATDREVTRLVFNPSGQCLAASMWDNLRFFDMNNRSRRWDEGAVLPLKNALALTCLEWKADGSRVATGTLTGAVDLFDTCLRRYSLRGQFEFTNVAHNQVIVKSLKTGHRIVLKSHMGYEIFRVNVQKDRYLIAHTQNTLLIGDLNTCQLSEIPWQLSGKERFIFSNPQVCMIYVAGELTLVEYGRNEILGTCRTTRVNSHRLSVRIHSRPADQDDGAAGADGAATVTTKGGRPTAKTASPASGSKSAAAAKEGPKKAIAYLVDAQTIQVDDLVTGRAGARIQHSSKIDWLELNHRATRLLFRDKQHQLFLCDVATENKVTLLEFCSYVQWVPDSDVVVAQNRNDLCIWYSIEAPDRVAVISIKGGEVIGIERGGGKTEVLVEEGVQTMGYSLEESLIEFGEAMQDGDHDRACDYLDRVALSPETEALWEKLANTAFQQKRLHIAERCYAAVGDVARAGALKRVRNLAAEIQKEFGGDGFDHFTVQAELYLLQKEPKRAEQIYLENGQVEKAMDMWDSILRYDLAIELAEARNHPDAAARRTKYYNWLVESHQEEQAAELREREAKYIDAINLYLRGGVPARAAYVVATYNVKPEQHVLEAIATALSRAEIFEKAGDFFEKLKLNDRAIEAYTKGNVYRRAVDLARRVFPDKVISLEEGWGDYLVSQKQVDQAINHYIEARAYGKSVQAAISSRQWLKAVNIIETHMVGNESDSAVQNFYKQIALHYEEVNQLSEAEKYYVRANAVEEAVEMYLRRNQTDHMLRVAQRHLTQQQLVALFVDQAKLLENKGDYAAAERIYLKVNEVKHAIAMYQKARDFSSTIRLVASYMPEHLLQFHLSLAAQFQAEGNFRMAEQHCINAKDWKRAVDMYRALNMWDDAVRVAKVHGGAEEAKGVIVERALAIDADDAVKLLNKFGMLDAGIEAACDVERYEAAIRWARIAAPAKVANIFTKQAMLFEDRGQFPQAEECFVKGGRPREAVEMYIHEGMLQQAMKVAELHDPGAVPTVCTARGRVAFANGDFKEAEELLVRGNAPELLVRLYRDNKMLRDAQRVAQEYTPELVSDITREMGLDDKDPLSAGRLLEQSGEYALAIEAYLRCGKEHTDDAALLVQLWQRAVKLAMQYNRSMLKETSRAAVQKMVDAGCNEDAARALEDIEDYKGAITLYVRAKKFEAAETLAQRISPDLVDFVKRARVQHAMESGGGADSEIKEAIASNDWEKALKVARQSGAEQARIYASMYCTQVLLQDKNIEKALQVIARDGMETADMRFFKGFTSLTNATIARLPNREWDVQPLHDGMYKMVESMKNTGQPDEDVARAAHALTILHAYTMHQTFAKYDMKEQAAWVMLGLPRYIPAIPADKAFFDAARAAKDAGMLGTAFQFFNRFLDISDQIEEGEKDSSNIGDLGVFEHTDFPSDFPLPPQSTVDEAVAKEARDWVLARSLEDGFDRSMPHITDPTTNTPMFFAQLKSTSGTQFESCAVTGLPLFSHDPKTRCKGCQRPAKIDAWNKYVAVSKSCPWCKTNASVVLK